MSRSRRAFVATAPIALLTLVSCTAISGLNDLSVCGPGECMLGPEADAGGDGASNQPEDGSVGLPDASVLPLFSIGGAVSKLAGKGLSLKNSADTLAIAADGPFTFPTKLKSGDAYAVTIGSQPSDPIQICAVTNGTGTVSGADVTNVGVSCTTNVYSVGGAMVSAISGVVITNNGGDPLLLTPNQPFTFPTKVPSGMPFNVAIKTQGGGGTCTVSGATGTVGEAPVTTVVVNCDPGKFTIGGTTTGLIGAVIVQNNGTNDTKITSNGTFAFSQTLATGGAYAVTVLTNPDYPPRSQTCTVTKAGGTTGTANVTDVTLVCTTNTFTIGGTVSNLRGPSFVLKNKGGDDLTLTASGAYTFATAGESGTTYDVTVGKQPPGEKCTVKNGSGTITNAVVAHVDVECGQDPGIKCAPDVYCDTGTYCCFDRKAGKGTCVTTGTGCGAEPVTCDSAAECPPDGVCCGRYNKANGQFREAVCQASAQACAQSAGNVTTEIWCDPLAAAPCPAGMGCAGTSATGYAKCQ